jgi:Flp pilus assembly protein TadB
MRVQGEFHKVMIFFFLIRCRYILPNNLLFLLATRPPADVGSLKNAIKRTSSLLQSRLPELLTAISEGVNSGLSAASTLETSAPELLEPNLSRVTTSKIVDHGMSYSAM